MLSEKREQLIQKLLTERTRLEQEILELKKQDMEIKGDKSAFDQEGAQPYQESAKIFGIASSRFAMLKKVNLRIADIESGRFNGLCPKCGAEIELMENCLLSFCISCQKIENGKKK